MHYNLLRLEYAFALLLSTAIAPEARAGLIITIQASDGFLSEFSSPNGAHYKASFVREALNFAAHEFESPFSDPIHVNIQLQTNRIGLSGSLTKIVGGFTYDEVKSALTNDNTAHPSAEGDTSIAHLPGADPTPGTSFSIARAEAKALGLIPDDLLLDGTIIVNRDLSYTFDLNHRNEAGKYDFIGIVEHEISEIMGRGTTLNPGNAAFGYFPDDLFRFTAPGRRSLNKADQNVYLSIDDGATKITGLNARDDGDLQDYDGANAADPFNAFIGTNQSHSISATDVTNMDVIGYDLIAVPEPSSILLVAIGMGCFRGRCLGRRRSYWQPGARCDVLTGSR